MHVTVSAPPVQHDFASQPICVARIQLCFHNSSQNAITGTLCLGKASHRQLSPAGEPASGSEPQQTTRCVKDARVACAVKRQPAADPPLVLSAISMLWQSCARAYCIRPSFMAVRLEISVFTYMCCGVTLQQQKASPNLPVGCSSSALWQPASFGPCCCGEQLACGRCRSQCASHSAIPPAHPSLRSLQR